MSSSAFPPAPEDEPDVCVPASFAGGAAEVLALIGDLVNHDRDGVIRARIEDFLDEAGAEPRPAADWLVASVFRLAREAEAALAREGIAVDRELPRYWRAAPRPWQQGGQPLWRRSPRRPRRTTRRPPTSGSAATWPTSA